MQHPRFMPFISVDQKSKYINHLINPLVKPRKRSKLCFIVKQTHYRCQWALNALSPPAQQTEFTRNRHHCRQLSGFQHLLPAVLRLKKNGSSQALLAQNARVCACVLRSFSEEKDI